MTKEMLIDNITSTKIEWFEGKDITKKEEEKKCKNKSKKILYLNPIKIKYNKIK